MARVNLMPGIESISGTIGDVTFFTRNGKTFMTKRSEPELPKKATRAQKAQYRKRTMVNTCVALVQVQMDDVFVAICQRKKIRDRMRYLYEKLSPEIRTRTKLQKAIMTAYYEGENGSEMHRETIGNGSVKS